MDNKNLVTYLKKSFFTGSFKTIIVALSTIVLLPLIIHEIGIKNYGLISLTMIFGGMVVFADFGISKTVTLLIGQNKDDTKNINDIITTAFFINILLILVLGIIVYLIIYLNIPILGEKFEESTNIQNFIILIGFLILILSLINNFLTAILESFYLSHYMNIGFTLSSVLLNLFIYMASILSDSIYILLFSPVLSFISVNIFFLYIIKKHTFVQIGKINKNELKHILSISYKFLSLGTVNGLVLPINKYFLILITGNSALLGIFDIALKIALIANSFLNSIAQPLFGVFSNMEKNDKRIYNILVKTSLLLFIMYIIGNILYYFLGNEVSYLIDKINHEKLYFISMVLLLGVTFSSVSEPFYRALLAQEKLKQALYLKLLVPILNLIFYFILTNIEILNRFTIAYSISVLISSIIVIIYYLKNHHRVTS